MKQGFLLTSFITGRTIRYHIFINLNLWTLKFGKTFNFISPCKFAQKKKKNSFKKELRHYIQLYSQPYFSGIYSQHSFSFFSKSIHFINPLKNLSARLLYIYVKPLLI